MSTVIVGAILYLPLAAALAWGVYCGEVTRRAAIGMSVALVVLNTGFALLKLPTPWYIVTYVATLIYLVAVMYGGDVKIW